MAKRPPYAVRISKEYVASQDEKRRLKAKESHKKRYKNNPAPAREHAWKLNGIINADGSLFKWHDFQVLLAQQKNGCAICKIEDPGSKNWCADHDSKTGIIRGLLCNRCNCGLGLFKDSLFAICRAVEYLKQKGF